MKIVPVEHGVERGHFVDTHWRHSQEISDVVHNANTRPSFILSLTEIKKRNDCSLFILRRIVGNNVLGALQIFGIKFEGDLTELFMRYKGFQLAESRTLGLL
jgi:hypothetical protein